MTELKDWEPTKEERDQTINALPNDAKCGDERKALCRLGAAKLIKWLLERCDKHGPIGQPLLRPFHRALCHECLCELEAWAKQIEEGK